MGKSRSRVLALQLRMQRLYKAKKKRELKPPYMCPKCWHQVVDVMVKKPFVFVYCKECDQGELMPHHPELEKIDYYCFVIDKIARDRQPVFKFRRMKGEILSRVQKHITLGSIEVFKVI